MITDDELRELLAMLVEASYNFAHCPSDDTKRRVEFLTKLIEKLARNR